MSNIYRVNPYHQQPPEALQRAVDRMLTEATTRVAMDKKVEASRSYLKAAQYAEQLAEKLDDTAEAEAMRMRAVEYRSRSLALARDRSDTKRCRPFEEHEKDDTVYTDEETDTLEQQILLLIDDSPRNIDWTKIGGLKELKQELKFHYGLTMAKVPEGVDLEGWNNVMFYGPPGTGKTLMACAIANKLNATFFSVSASQIVSKWVGESGKLISTLYRLARKFTKDGTPSIIFIDEFDSLCKSRAQEGQLHHQQMLASILSEIDGYAQKGRKNLVLTIGATNRPWDLDAAVLSRFERRMYISLPDHDARKEIFQIHLDQKGIKLDESTITYDFLAEHTHDLTGREIARLCKEVVAAMVARLNPVIPDLVDEGLKSIRDYIIRLEPLTKADFEPMLTTLVPDTTKDQLAAYNHWGKID